MSSAQPNPPTPSGGPPVFQGAPYPQVPVLDMNQALAVLLVNLFFPGIGTIVAGVMGNMKLVGRGLAQLVLWLIVVGWIWAFVTSIQCLQNAKARA